MLNLWSIVRRFSPFQLSLICVTIAFVLAVGISHLFWQWFTGAVPDGLTLVAGAAAIFVSVPMVAVFVVGVYRLDDANRRLISTKTKLHLQNEELAKARDALSELNEDLEFRVASRTADLQDALRVAENANAAKAEFLANMSHELRTPLNGILGYAEMIANRRTLFAEVEPERIDEYTGAILSSGRHLNAMVNDLLDLSKIDFGEFEVLRAPNCAKTIVGDVVGEFRPMANARNQQVEVTYSGGDSMFETDGRAVYQILANLLSNALKYSGEGDCVNVDVSFDETEVAMTVADRGIGMSADAISKATTPFSKFSNAHIASGQSVGLGLSIVKKLCKLLGGSLSITSEEGVGTTATVRFRRDVQASEDGQVFALVG